MKETPRMIFLHHSPKFPRQETIIKLAKKGKILVWRIHFKIFKIKQMQMMSLHLKMIRHKSIKT